MPTTATRPVRCPECGTVLDVVDRDAGTILVETIGRLPEECCQRAATDGWKKVGVFHMKPRED